MSLRAEFVTLANSEGANVRGLCRRFGISPKTAYKWLDRHELRGAEGLVDLSRRPLRSPYRTPVEMEGEVLTQRRAHPSWGGRKIRARLQALGHEAVPAASTITEVLRRNGLLSTEEGCKHKAWERFEHPLPNDLWQMDFKGHFAIQAGRCHALTVLDDHSRFAIGLQACPDETERTVRQRLTQMFRLYGLPWRILTDNGSPWGAEMQAAHTALTTWLLRLGIEVSHGRPRHPQTQGKDERFHRTLQAEVLRYERFGDLSDCQRRFDEWRGVYNLERPHEALGMAVPASRYQPSRRLFPETLAPIEYGPADIVRKVHQGGRVTYRGRCFRVGKAFVGYPVALRATTTDGVLNVVFCYQVIKQIDLRSEEAFPAPAARFATAGSFGPALRSPREAGREES